jgi:hypothetical protein
MKVCGIDNTCGSACFTNCLHNGHVQPERHRRAAIRFGDENSVEAQLVERFDITPRELGSPVVVLSAGRDNFPRESADLVQDEAFVLGPSATLLQLAEDFRQCCTPCPPSK